MLTGPAACLCWGSESGYCSSLSKQEGQLCDIPPAGLASLCVLLFLSCSTQEERFAFLAEWYDPSAALLRRYQLLYYPKDGSVEMVRRVAQILDLDIQLCLILSPHKHLSVIYSLMWRTSAPFYGELSMRTSIQRICLLATEWTSSLVSWTSLVMGTNTLPTKWAVRRRGTSPGHTTQLCSLCAIFQGHNCSKEIVHMSIL